MGEGSEIKGHNHLHPWSFLETERMGNCAQSTCVRGVRDLSSRRGRSVCQALTSRIQAHELGLPNYTLGVTQPKDSQNVSPDDSISFTWELVGNFKFSDPYILNKKQGQGPDPTPTPVIWV